MKLTMKVALAAGATLASIFLSTGKAEAEPVVSSWYGPGLEGNATASGEVFRADEHTAAHPNLPFGTELLVTYGGRQAVVRVTDRGPYADGRGLDLSQAAAEKVGLTVAGADTVDARVLGPTGYPTGYETGPAGYPTGYETRFSSKRNPHPSRSARNWGVESLRERPHLKVLGASFTPYSRPSSRTCQEASMVTPTAGASSMSKESAKTEVVGAVARCSANKARPLA
ncbi:MAG TPA: septal ring lytic transglycosylase RlpA family protein [Rubrobacteraceae bacterium]|jgi:rare lipoprotein A